MNIRTRLSFSILFIAIFGFAQASYGAEEELTLLTITGDLIGKLESLNEDANPGTIINSYYELLDQQTGEQLLSLRRRMDRRLEDYQVAYTAADTAEINETLDDLSFYWASIRTLHASEFTEEVIGQLAEAYGELYDFIRTSE